MAMIMLNLMFVFTCPHILNWLAKSLIFRVPCFWPLTFTPICPDQIIRLFMEPPLCWQNAQHCWWHPHLCWYIDSWKTPNGFLLSYKIEKQNPAEMEINDRYITFIFLIAKILLVSGYLILLVESQLIYGYGGSPIYGNLHMSYKSPPGCRP